MIKLFKHSRIAFLATVMCALLLMSVGMNIYQHNKVNKSRNNIIRLTQHFMSMHEGGFNNALFSSGSLGVKNINNI